MLNSKHIQPGWDLSVAHDRFDQINCGFADQVYSIFILKKYGVNSCREDQYQKFKLQKSILDLTLLLDPTLCVVEVCGDAPCGVSASIIVYTGQACPAARNPNATITVPIIVCDPATDVQATITFQSPN